MQYNKKHVYPAREESEARAVAGQAEVCWLCIEGSWRCKPCFWLTFKSIQCVMLPHGSG